ncbi:MAG: hypothetical protein EPO65_09100 [Dehalococcoidia bacterium]|nr:MAG: hypothetical protein EPO65_09100 [Dehalococcoidia bacterium]
MPRITRAFGIAAAASVALALVACGGSSESKPAKTDADAKPAASGLFTGAATSSASIDMTDLKFSTTALTSKAGDVLEVALNNKGSIEHDFSIAKLPGDKALRVGGKDTEVTKNGNDVHAHLKAGEAGAVRMKAATAGTYEFFCTVPGHKEAGMKGTLTVQ